MTERASGWYDDPQDPDLLRYWDGILWSDRTMPKVKPNLEQSRIGDARRQYDEEQERLRAAERAAAHRGSYSPQSPMRPYQGDHQDPYGPPQQHGYRRPSYGQQPYQPRPVKTTQDGEPTASWWRRLFAYFIDNILLSGVALAVSWHWLQPWFTTISRWYGDVLDAAQAGRSQPPVPTAIYHVPWEFPLIALLLYLAYEIALVAWRGQTVGHLICGVRVRGAGSTAKPGLNAAVIRAVVKGVSNITSFIPFLGSLGSIFSLIDGLVPLGDRSAQSIHDKVAKTYVVRARAAKMPQAQGGPTPPYLGR